MNSALANKRIADLKVLEADFTVKDSTFEEHPIQTGRIGGALRDIRFRIVELEAFRQALAEVRLAFLTLGAPAGAQPLDKLQKRVATESLYKEVFEPRYLEHRRQTAVPRRLLADDAELAVYDRYSPLYSRQYQSQ